MIIVNGLQPLTIITRSSALNLAAVPDPPMHNLGQNGHHVFQKHKLHLSQSVSNDIPASFLDMVTQRGILNVELSDHQLLYCTRKITRIERGSHKQTKSCSFKNKTVDGYEKALVEITFPEYKRFDNANDA